MMTALRLRSELRWDASRRFTAMMTALTQFRRDPIAADRVALVVAHPDDETIGIGGQLWRLRGTTILYVTHGAPRNMAYAAQKGFADRRAYAMARRREAEGALAEAGVPATAISCLGFDDQESGCHLATIAERLAAFFMERRIEIVLTHPYEGGHPDHDATAFAVHAAQALIERGGGAAPEIAEMAFYHAGQDGQVMQAFPRCPAEVPEVRLWLYDHAWEVKQRMLRHYQSQRKTLMPFSSRIERLRAAPRYDFTAPANGGDVHYAHLDWGMTVERWCDLAAGALHDLGLRDLGLHDLSLPGAGRG